MPSYDAGPGDWSDRDWESPDHKPASQAKRRLTLPPWLLVTAAVVIAILLCVALVLIIRALRAEPEAVPAAEITAENTAVPGAVSTSTAISVIIPTEVVTPTPTVELPGLVTPSPVVFTEIAPGAQVVVQGTLGQGLNLRASPTTLARLVGSARDGNTLTVLEGPQQADGYTWWKVKTADGKEGWAAGKFLALKPQ